jgi:hypothetical protein
LLGRHSYCLSQSTSPHSKLLKEEITNLTPLTD